MIMSEKIDLIMPALVKAQGGFTTVIKNKIAKGKSFDFDYADLAAVIAVIKEPLNKNEIMFTQGIHKTENSTFVDTRLIHSSGQYIGDVTPVAGNFNDPQSFGSAVSYTRRYSIVALCGIAVDGEDDDGKGAKKPKIQTPELTVEEKATIEEVRKRLLDIASQNDLIPDVSSIKNFAMNKAKRLPATPEEITKFVDFIVNNNHLQQVCKPMPRK